ncbi:MAG: hypothetical protein ACI4S2_00565 [Lachnospiraceae bacterium]
MKIGLSWAGVIIFALPMLINIIYVIFPPVNAPKEPPKVNRAIEFVEQATRMLYMLAICFLVTRKGISYRSFWLYAGIVFLVLYYIVWIRYFAGGRDVALLTKNFGPIPMPLAVFPVLYFLCAAVWVHNMPAFIIMIVFGIAHNIVSYSSL